ncbi:universal stress protein [Nonomuraea sp. B12E4]|uniref:universal stress protein n=1 Tax=Nonomuraea sp. B12E4 TaxID=3153564 RepID=UPI00325E6E45
MILVGVDGSRAGLEAAGWAAREASLRGVPLTVAHAIPGWACATESGRLAEVAAWMRQGGESVLAAAEERARRGDPQISVRSTLLPGDPRAALIGAAEDAELLVVGSHGFGGVRGMLVGSVAYGVAGHASCDVVVVREQALSPRGEVVAGVDGSPASSRVLEFAFAEARLRELRLHLVRAQSHPWPHGFAPDGGRVDDLPAVRRKLAERYPDVSVVEDVIHGHPAEVLRQASAGADLLVVGSHGHGVLAGTVLGSVSHALLHHAACPLAVVRSAR